TPPLARPEAGPAAPSRGRSNGSGARWSDPTRSPGRTGREIVWRRTSPSTAAQVLVREREGLAPVVIGQVVASGPDVIADPAVNGVVHARLLAHGQAVRAEQTVDGVGAEGGQELALGIGPTVLDRAGDVERPRGDQRQQLVLVHGQIGLAVG